MSLLWFSREISQLKVNNSQYFAESVNEIVFYLFQREPIIKHSLQVS